jgi:hypothetical protein
MAKQTYLPQSRLAHRKVDLSTAKQTYPRRNKPYPDQNKVIHGKLTLSTPNHSYPAQSQAICRKVDLFAATQGDIAVNKVTLR